MTTFSKKILAVDFDGTLVSNRYPNVGEFNWEVVNYVKSKKAAGWIIILSTCRHSQDLKEAVKACETVGIKFDYVNENVPELVAMFGDSRKIYCDELLDDTVKYLIVDGKFKKRK